MAQAENKNDLIFALDIGTHSVVGVLGKADGDRFVAIDFAKEAHQSRAMQDGQIEDINKVAQTVFAVKSALEKRNGVTLTKVAIAAAGRSLKTERGYSVQQLDENTEISPSMVQSFEYAALSDAQEKFLSSAENREENEQFFCVGYSVTYYKLDDYTLSNLQGHKGNEVSLEVIAAFLPHHVVRSLYAVTERNGLEVDNLTLEPIAAIHVIVPRDLRLLNIAIVDIGAGTSDIAISKNGSIVSYGMITTAGNEVNESIMRALLVDYETAEKIKVAWSNAKEEIEFVDILGFEKTVRSADVSAICEDTVRLLGEGIAKEILHINDTAPVAVFLVGGTSQVPGLCELVARQLDLPQDRVAVGGKRAFRAIDCPPEMVSPEYVTPLGIGVVALLYPGCNFFSVEVNGKKIMVLDHGKIRVFDALLMAGIKPAKLIGISAPALTYKVDGERFVKRGEPSKAGSLAVNGKEASIDDEIRQGDRVIALPAQNGKPVTVTIQDIAKDYPPRTVLVCGKETVLFPQFFVFDKPVQTDYPVRQGDEIAVDYLQTVQEVLAFSQVDFQQDDAVFINGQKAGWDTPVKNGDEIMTEKAMPQQGDGIAAQAKPGDLQAQSAKVLLNGEEKELPAKPGEPFILVDMLNFVDINTENPEGTLVLQINGRDAAYTDIVNENDRVDIYWKKIE